jgi:2-polyprenyl-6-methoxyphenol hydroxylase-like FAD-dependent oxidoreductase
MADGARGESARSRHEVVIVGGGPAGLMLAGELGLAGVDVVVLERRASQDLEAARAGGLHPRTLEVLDQRGIADRFVAAGQLAPPMGFAGVRPEPGDLPTRHPHLLALWQRDFEPILARWVEELGVPIQRGREVTSFVEDELGVDVRLADGTARRGAYLVGCDGGRSQVRKTAGIDFRGIEATASWIRAEVDMDETPVVGVRPEGGGIGPIDRERGGNPYGVVLKDGKVEPAAEPTLADLREALVAAYGTDFGAHDPSSITRFTDMTRQASSYRKGRVLLAGDAAHVHPPQGGQGLNLGVQDAVNLGWKLAQVVKGRSPESLLDTYTAERHPVGARVLELVRSMVALAAPDEGHEALRNVVTEILASANARQRIAARIAGLDIRYDLGDGHPLIGWRMPDLDLDTADGSTRVFELLHEARPLLLRFDEGFDDGLGTWGDHVRLVRARAHGPWELPVVGVVEAPGAVLIRPDGHVAWAGDPSDAEMPRALERWFGPPG